MVTFNIREAGNEVLRILEKELRPSCKCRLTIDLLIPDLVEGDKEGLYNSILLICQFLNPKLLYFDLNIELSKESHSPESINVRIDVKGTANKQETIQQFLRVHRMEVDALLARLPYSTNFSASGVAICFWFEMQFFDESSNKRHSAEIFSKKILLAEDDDITAMVFISFMEEWGYTVTRVSDGASAVDAAKMHDYDVILMDTFLPKLSGAEAIRKIRELDKRTPIIALTTSPIDKDFTGRYTGANDVFIKPVIGADLQRILRRYS